MARIMARMKGVRKGDQLLKPEVIEASEMSQMVFTAPKLGMGRRVGLYKGLTDKEVATCKDIWIFDPSVYCHDAVKRIPCGNKDCKGLCTDKGWHKNSCLRIIDFDDYFHLVSKRWECEVCGSSFNAYDQGILDKLPPDISAVLPLVLRPSHGMTQKLMDFINTAGSRPGFSYLRGRR